MARSFSQFAKRFMYTLGHLRDPQYQQPISQSKNGKIPVPIVKKKSKNHEIKSEIYSS